MKNDKVQKRDHRELGKSLDLFSFHEVAPGAVFWHPKGYLIYKALVEFLRKRLAKEGYQEVSTPVLVKSKLFEKSGHWEFFYENMFHFKLENETYTLKPMNCPEGCLIFASKTRSYQDLPIRFSDFGILHRNELSGVLGGVFRVRQFTIDDAHNFIRPDQIQDEIHALLLLVVDFYKSLGFKPEFYLSTKPDKAMGDPKLWQEAEKGLKKALERADVKFGIKEKDGAFYGPKIDIHIKDSQDRDWQLATIQLDFQTPERMQLKYIDEDGSSKRPVIVHQAILGSVERFIGILTEHYQGAFPLWISPTQVTVLPVSEKYFDLAKKVVEILTEEGVRVEVDLGNKTVAAKIRDATLQKIPYMLIIGERERDKSKVKSQKSKDYFVSVRTRGGKDQGLLSLDRFVQILKEKIGKFQ
ncbi:threonine--tRNA ligase [Candidatus Roizmanbacteria bacterium]|nr:threonine--tRNA ligase [Candidatus Roizmanbacteria bacterium]